MISDQSPFRHLPTSLERRQALFIVGIRHAAEIADLAYTRLKATLTELGNHTETEGPISSALTTSALLDAWALVDVFDRFRALWLLSPGIQFVMPPPGMPSFKEISEPVRKLRNVTDHIAQRADYVLAHEGTALGTLSWFTVRDPDVGSGSMNVLIPGTVHQVKASAATPLGCEVESPSGYVHLSAGEHTANLSAVFQAMRYRIQHFELSLEKAFEGVEERAPCDLLVRFDVSPPGVAD